MVGAIQLPTLGMNATRLEFYFKKASERGAKLLLLGEYVINHFFKELIAMPVSMIQEQTNSHLKILKKLSKEYNIVVVAPIVDVKKEKIYKKVAIISPKSTKYYMQQLLINYPHWNEEEFFDNPIRPLKNIFTFKLNGFKIGIMYGFEIHFDKLWQSVQKQKVDLVLIPSASTFGSKQRWEDLLSSRAFLNSCYILRANRVGDYQEDGIVWNFYGESMLINPDGEIEMKLEERESMLIEEIMKEEIEDSLHGWGFHEQLEKRGEL
jgi:predicted amidohydrolase